tara:strand:- start:237 stop:857 length:621 start_codon:yes stop_codon:yes gene_type:complete
MDELEALNLLLRAIGSSPVNSLDTDHPDAVNAKATLNRMRKQSQLSGWWFNIDYCVSFIPQPNGDILIPSTISKVVFESRYLVNRGGKLYDKMNQTYSFTEQQLATRVQYITPWDEMPVSLQLYTTYMAAAQYVRDELEDTAKEMAFKEDAAGAGLLMKKDDLEQGQYNIFDKKRVIRARIGVRPYALHNSNIVGFDGRDPYGSGA